VEVVLPGKLTEIATEAFADCQSLRIVRLPQELSDLGSQVFKGCPLLGTLALGDVKRSWDKPESLLGGGKLRRLELIGSKFEDVKSRPIEGWLAADAEVVSVGFAGEILGRFRIVPP
jgi:hypothetical protein